MVLPSALAALCCISSGLIMVDENDWGNIVAVSYTKFTTHLPKSDDLTLIVLKRHLLIEEEINSLLVQEFKDSDPLFKTRPNVSIKIAILRAVFGKKRAPQLNINAIDKLNTLRNDMAHNLSSLKLDTKLDALINSLKVTDSNFHQMQRHDQLKVCITKLSARATAERIRDKVLI
jgi:hypothetical protein